jgi:CHASE2 domain-containing sensor protein
MFNITTIKNGIKKAGVAAAALALVAGIGFGSAPSASASSLTASRLATTSVVQQQTGAISVSVYFSNPSTATQQATVAILDSNGRIIGKALVGSTHEVTFKADVGTYKVRVNADGYGTEIREVKVNPDSTSSVKVTLYSVADR